MSMHYILDKNKNLIACDLLTWCKFLEEDNIRVKLTNFEKYSIKISTVFLGLDHSYLEAKDNSPIVFETMIFGGESDKYQERYCTWKEAVAGHREAVRKVIKEIREKQEHLCIVGFDICEPEDNRFDFTRIDFKHKPDQYCDKKFNYCPDCGKKIEGGETK